MFFTGAIVGLFVGICLGILICGLLFAAKRNGEAVNRRTMTSQEMQKPLFR